MRLYYIILNDVYDAGFQIFYHQYLCDLYVKPIYCGQFSGMCMTSGIFCGS